MYVLYVVCDVCVVGVDVVGGMSLVCVGVCGVFGVCAVFGVCVI